MHTNYTVGKHVTKESSRSRKKNFRIINGADHKYFTPCLERNLRGSCAHNGISEGMPFGSFDVDANKRCSYCILLVVLDA